MERQFQLKRLADAVADIYAQIAVLSRVSSIFEDQGVEPSGQERYIAETFCTRAASRVSASLDRIERNDDERASAIAKLAYKRASTATRSSRTDPPASWWNERRTGGAHYDPYRSLLLSGASNGGW